MRVALDTNIYISAILFGGLPELPIRLARSRKITLLVSEPIIAELTGVLRTKFNWDQDRIRDVEKELRVIAKVVKTKTVISAVSDEPDNRILECAVDGRAHLIVSGDSHLIALESYAGTRIISPRQFAERFGLT